MTELPGTLYIFASEVFDLFFSLEKQIGHFASKDVLGKVLYKRKEIQDSLR